MSEKSIKLIALIVFDLLIIMVPFLINISPGLVQGVGSVMFVLTAISLAAILVSSKTRDMHETLIKEAKIKPKWWNVYDAITDIAFVISWAYVGWEALAMLLVIMKLALAIKFPDYYAEKGKDND